VLAQQSLQPKLSRVGAMLVFRMLCRITQSSDAHRTESVSVMDQVRLQLRRFTHEMKARGCMNTHKIGTVLLSKMIIEYYSSKTEQELFLISNSLSMDRLRGPALPDPPLAFTPAPPGGHEECRATF